MTLFLSFTHIFFCNDKNNTCIFNICICSCMLKIILCTWKAAEVSQMLVPAVPVFGSVSGVRKVLCETAGLHFPLNSGQPRLTAYGPIPWTAEWTPGQAKQMLRFKNKNVQCPFIPHNQMKKRGFRKIQGKRKQFNEHKTCNCLNHVFIPFESSRTCPSPLNEPVPGMDWSGPGCPTLCYCGADTSALKEMTTDKVRSVQGGK